MYPKFKQSDVDCRNRSQTRGGSSSCCKFVGPDHQLSNQTKVENRIIKNNGLPCSCRIAIAKFKCLEEVIPAQKSVSNITNHIYWKPRNETNFIVIYTCCHRVFPMPLHLLALQFFLTTLGRAEPTSESACSGFRSSS